MAHYVPDEGLFAALKDRVVVISGGATGIGAATVHLLSRLGAKVFIGDVNVLAAAELVKQHSSVKFVRCDVSEYDDVYTLFRTAYDQHGHIDHAISCAGIFEQGNWFDPELTIDTVGKDRGNTNVINVNVLGTLQFSRIAAVFLRADPQRMGDRTLTLLSSVNAFRESPGLFLYQPSKHAVHGLLRSSRKTLFDRDGIRVNAICPGVTDTPMTAKIAPAFREAGLFVQPAESVAKIIVGLVATPDIHGKAYYVEGGDAFEFEDSSYNSQAQWLGEEPTRRMRVNTEAVQKGLLKPKA